MDMLDYAPDCLAGDGSALYGQEWTVAWDSEAMSADVSLVSRLMAASKEVTSDASAKPMVGRVSPKFQPERMSGYCAS